MSYIGPPAGNCFNFVFESTDFINKITVKHSENAINYLQFTTKKGLVRTVGSDQSDTNNEFNWEKTDVILSDHERLQGAFAHVGRVGLGGVRLKTIGFIKGDCWYGDPLPKKPVENKPRPAGSSGISNNGVLKKLPKNIGVADADYA